MPELSDMVARVDRTLYGDPERVGAYELQGQARLTGWAGGAEAAQGGGGGAWFKLEPTALHVRDRDGVETVVPVTDPQTEALRGMALAAAAIAGLGVALTVAGRIWRAR
ncbi:MAG: hypothetical protein R2844_07140 [Caldilineales bacterium]